MVKKLKRIIEYKEKEPEMPSFEIKSRTQKVVMIICFILLLPMIALVTWTAEFIRLIKTERIEYYEELNDAKRDK